jgi:LuxR family maltose regulon positive regulatory protein
MKRVLQYLPAKLHLLFLTRKDPPFPMGLWNSRQLLTELRAADLRFTREETQAFLEKHLRKRLPDQIVGVLNGRTEGWIAALQLIQISLTGAADPDQLVQHYLDSDRSITDYLMDEVISRQPAEIVDFLAVTAIFERFCVPLCDDLLSGRKAAPDARGILDRIEKDNLFLVPLGSERRWYRYHHLFQSLLRRHLKQNMNPKRTERLHQRAGNWFAGQGLVEEALHHFLAAGDADAAARLLEDNMHSAIDNDLSRRTLGRWLDMFPKSAVDQYPGLVVAKTYQKMFYWDFISMGPLLDHAEALLRNPDMVIEEARRLKLLQDVVIQRAFFFYWRGDIEAALRHARQALEVIPKERSYAFTLANLYTALALALSGRRGEARQLLSEALLEDCAEGSRNAGVLLVALTGINYYAGDLNAVEETAKRILTDHESVPVSDYWYAYALYFLACSAYERNLLDSASEHFGRIEQMRYTVTTRLYQEALIGLAIIAWAKGETDQAWECAAAARSFAMEKSDPYSLQIANSFHIRMQILAQNVRCNPADTAPPEDDSNKVWLEIPSLTSAECQVHRGTRAGCAAALQIAEEGLQQARKHHNTRQVIQFLAVKAVALKCAGRLDEALETLEKNLHMAEPLGFVRTFLDRGPPMAELLAALLEKTPETPYLQGLLDAFAAERQSERHASESSQEGQGRRFAPAPDETLPDGLSDRELDVLMLLQERLTNKEIAQQLFVSAETVKTHVSKIIQKLQVKNRRQAVDAARKLNLLPERRRRSPNPSR